MVLTACTFRVCLTLVSMAIIETMAACYRACMSGRMASRVALILSVLYFTFQLVKRFILSDIRVLLSFPMIITSTETDAITATHTLTLNVAAIATKQYA